MFFSASVVSSGDSMAREGAMLGVPSIYCGVRDMAANKVMINEGMLFHKNIVQFPEFINRIINNDVEVEKQDDFREQLEKKWVDVTEFIVKKDVCLTISER